MNFSAIIAEMPATNADHIEAFTDILDPYAAPWASL
jgi:hypothetical protein